MRSMRNVLVHWLTGLMLCSSSAWAGFVTIQGGQFICDGRVFKVKGANYYPKSAVWAAMWDSWPWSLIVEESFLLKDMGGGKGLNCVRILVPYSHGGWGGANVPENRLVKLENIVNMLGRKGIRSCVTLFDWETSFPAAGTPKESDHLKHLNAIVGRLKNNPYVFVWDVKNEPDHPDNIGGGDDWDGRPQKATIMSWLERMCNAVRAADPNHPVSAGIRWYKNAEDCLGFVDVAMYHSYWSHLASAEISTLKAAMGANQKPIVAEELGWPTNPTPCNRDGILIYDYTEAEQLAFFQTYLPLFEAQDIAGCIQWMAFDDKAYSSNQNEDFGHYFGLWTIGNTLKPGGVYYRDHFPVAPFPVEPDTSGPDAVTNLSVTPLDMTVILNWKNPENFDYARTVIRWSTTGFPASPSEGNFLCNRTAAPSSYDSFTHGSLTNGQPYFYSVFAYDDSGNFSTAASIYATPVSAPAGITVGTARTTANNVAVDLTRKIVSASLPAEGCIYVQEPDRSAGIRVLTTLTSLDPGTLVNVRGNTATRTFNSINMERQIASATVYSVGSGSAPVPFYTRSDQIGGGPLGSYTVGVKDSEGLNNIGLLVRIAGVITKIAGVYIYVDDGCGVPNLQGLDTPVSGVMVKTLSSAGLYVGQPVRVTGVVAGNIPVGWTQNRPFLLARTAADVEAF